MTDYDKYGYPRAGKVQELADRLHKLSNELPRSVGEKIEEIASELENLFGYGNVEKIEKDIKAKKVLEEIMEKAGTFIQKEGISRSKAIEKVLDEYPQLYRKYNSIKMGIPMSESD